MLPKISIIIPCYNAVSTIERTIRSLINQHYTNLELVLIDGGSNDGTMEIVNSYKGHFDRIISEPDRGQANALNKGFKLTTGEIWGWLCADDELTAGALLYFAKLFQINPDIDVITAGCKRIFADGTTFNTKPRADVMQRIAYHNGIEQPSTLWRATVHQQVGALDENYNYAFDWVWWNQLQQAGVRVLVADRVVSRYYFSDTNKTSTGSRETINEMYRIIKHYGPARGYLADIYLFLYENFDLEGYYDKPPHVERIDWWWYLLKQEQTNRFKLLYWIVCLWGLSLVFGRDRIMGYNWNFASRQERNLCWYKYPSIDLVPEPIVLSLENCIDPVDISTITGGFSAQPLTISKPKIAIDCCCFQLKNFESQRIWNLIFQEWSSKDFAGQILLLDREKTAPQLYGFKYCDLPRVNFQSPGHEAILLQEICDREQIDIFLSTGDTIPVMTHSIATIIDDFWLKNIDTVKSWRIAHASKFIVMSYKIAAELSRCFPNLNVKDMVVTPLNTERMFIPSKQVEIDNFRKKYHLDLPYLLLVDRDDREDETGTLEFFRAFAQFVNRDRYAIVWANRTLPVSPEISTLMEDHPFLLCQLPPSELKLAYGGATALVEMNLGAGATVLEAIFCGCPTIVERQIEIAKLLGNAPIYVDKNNLSELVEVLEKIQQASLREQLIRQGFEQTHNFSIQQMTEKLTTTIFDTYQQIQDSRLPATNSIWQSFRDLQIATYGYSDNLSEISEKLVAAEQTIASMKTTKFWLMREQWFKLKKGLKLTQKID